MVTQQYTAIVEQLEGDFVLTFPPELLNNLGWVSGDTLEWLEQSNRSWIIKKVV